MNLHRLGLFTILSIAVGSLGTQAQTPPPPANALASTLQPYVDKHAVAGLVALVANKDRVVDLEAVGYSSLANKTPMDVNDLFWIASMSKSVTGTAFMMLVDEGKVSLDDPVEKYLPEFKGQVVVDPNDPTRTSHPASHPILIKEILCHTSGIAVGQELTKEQRAAMDDHILSKEVADYAALPLRQQPGTKFEYNNAGINTAGRIIEVVSGMSYADFLQKRLFDPLGMKDTAWWPSLDQGKRLAHSTKFTADRTGLEDIDNYHGNKDGIDALAMRTLGSTGTVPPELLADMGLDEIFNYKYQYAMPAGGIFSTASDLAKLCQMLLNGGVADGKRYLSEAAIAQMTTVQSGNVYPNHNMGYCVGWEKQLTPGGYPAAGSFFHRGARSTKMWVDPTNQLVMILLTERMDMPGKDQEEMYGAFLKAAVEKFGVNAAKN